MTATRWNRRTKAVCFVLVLLVPEPVALVTILGLLPGQGPVSYDAFAVAAVISVLLVCDVLAAVVAFYLNVAPLPAKRWAQEHPDLESCARRLALRFLRMISAQFR